MAPLPPRERCSSTKTMLPTREAKARTKCYGMTKIEHTNRNPGIQRNTMGILKYKLAQQRKAKKENVRKEAQGDCDIRGPNRCARILRLAVREDAKALGKISSHVVARLRPLLCVPASPTRWLIRR